MSSDQAKFRSRIDPWILILLVIAIAGQIFALTAVLSSETQGSEALIVIGITIPGVLLIVSTLLRTHYTVSDGRVRVVCGPFAWNISISEITDISETHSPLSSPALSLDRLKISYGRNKRIMVSPADKRGFLKAIAKYAS